MIWIFTILYIICVAWLFKMMIDLANADLPDIMLRAFYILIVLSILFYQYVFHTTTIGRGFYSITGTDSTNDSNSYWNNLFNN